MKKKNKKIDDIFIEKPEINEIDLEMISTNISNPKKDYKNIVYEIILNLCSKSNENKANKKDIINKALKYNIDIMRVEDAIERLIRLKKICFNDDFIFIENK
jgi:hypothetical protein